MSILKMIYKNLGEKTQPDAIVGRVLIALSALLLAATPFTERLWTFDGFLRGGQDLEFTLLSLIVFFCLVILLARYTQHGLSVLMNLRRQLSIVIQDVRHTTLAPGSIVICLDLRSQSSQSCPITVPLRI